MLELQKLLRNLEPREALAALGPELRKILAHLDEETQVNFVTEMLGGREGDKLSSLVDL